MAKRASAYLKAKERIEDRSEEVEIRGSWMLGGIIIVLISPREVKV